jgi:GH43 family beta-xylosidase
MYYVIKKRGMGARDPWLFKHNGYFYHCFAAANKLYVTKSKTLDGFENETPVLVYEPTNEKYNKEVWAPELAIINDKCYIYVACDDGDNNNHRMCVLENNSNDPQKPYTFHGVITPKQIDGQ